MATENRFTRVLKAPAKERPVLDLATSTVETVADILMKDELFAAVPIFSTAFKAMKAVDSLKDRLFVAKLVAFVREVENAPSEVREKIARNLSTQDEGRKAGETLILVLEKLTDMDKPALLGALLVHYGQSRITAAELRRLVSAVDVAFGDDLAEFLDETEAQLAQNNKLPHREALLNTGLIRMYGGQTVDSIGSIKFGINELGLKLHELVRMG